MRNWSGKPGFLRRGRKKRALFLSVLALCAACSAERLRIHGIDPLAGLPGEYITIKGAGFGKSRGESFVSVAGTRPTASSYREWSDGQIVFKLPEFGEAGLIYVHKDARKSNPVIFLTSSAIPRVVRQPRLSRPLITAGEGGVSGFAGRMITLRGTGFGETREYKTEPGRFSVARFSSLYGAGQEAEGGGAWLLEPAASEGAYLSWKEREIVARIPDGAGSGFVSVMTDRGESNRLPLEVRYRGGGKALRDKRVFAITYSVDIAVEAAAPGASLYVWLPHPADTAAQKPGEILSRSARPFLERHEGFSLYRFTGLKAGFREKVSVERLVEVMALETRLDAAAINTAAPAGFEKVYLEESRLVPSNDAGIRKAAAEITGREQNPYRKARLVYAALADTFLLQAAAFPGGALEALAAKRADAYGAALLFCALCRASGVAAAPVSGVFVDRDGKSFPHYWAQFWLEDFGWTPVDVLLGAGKAPASWGARPDFREYYFGNRDNQRIVFSEGETALSAMDSRSRVLSPERHWSLQNIHEEASFGLTAYSASWGDVMINGVY